jgi:hypothetical protein
VLAEIGEFLWATTFAPRGSLMHLPGTPQRI